MTNSGECFLKPTIHYTTTGQLREQVIFDTGSLEKKAGLRTGKKRLQGGGFGNMGLLTILKKVKQKERELQLLMLSLDNTGKTTILKKFNGENTTISLTLSFNTKALEPQGFKLNLWDAGSQKSQHPYWQNYFESTAGLTWVVDGTHLRRMRDCQQELQSLLVEERLAGATLLTFTDKQDLSGALSSNAIHKALELDSIHSHHRCIQATAPSPRITCCPASTGYLLDDISSHIFTAN